VAPFPPSRTRAASLPAAAAAPRVEGERNGRLWHVRGALWGDGGHLVTWRKMAEFQGNIYRKPMVFSTSFLKAKNRDEEKVPIKMDLVGL